VQGLPCERRGNKNRAVKWTRKWFVRLLRPPAKGASEEEQLRFVRRCGLSQSPFLVLVWVVLLTLGGLPTWVLIILGVGTAVSLQSLASLTWRIHRIHER
jgi:hypothetical protein